MRRILLLATAIFITLSAHAQFILTPTGFTTENDGKEYYVLEVDGKTQQELYDAVNVWIGGHFVSPKDVVSAPSSNNQISINAVVKGLTVMPRRLVEVPVDVNFTWQILFKDGKIRFNLPIINNMIAPNTSQTLYFVRPSAMGDGIFKKDGSLVDEYSKRQLEDYFNRAITEIANSLTNVAADEW